MAITIGLILAIGETGHINSTDMDNKTYSVCKFEKSKKIIVFFGSQHSKREDQVTEIEKEINQLNPEIILIEGHYDQATYKLREESLSKGGEMGFTSYLAKKNKIKLLSNDPPDEDSILFITKKYGKNICFLYFFIKNLDSYTRNKKEKLKEWSEYTISEFIKKSNWSNYDYSIKNLNKIFRSLTGKNLDINQDFYKYLNPHLSISVFNEISRDLSNFRDSFMMSLLKKVLIKYDKIFIIKGKSHLEKQRDDIYNLLK